MVLRKIIKIDATRCKILRLTCTKFDFGWGSTPDPAGGSYSALPDPLAGFKGPTSKEREGEGRGRDGQEGRGRGRDGRGGPLLSVCAPWLRKLDPPLFLDEFFIPKTRVLGLSVGEDFVILACIVFTECQRVSDRQADGQADGHPDRS